MNGGRFASTLLEQLDAAPGLVLKPGQKVVVLSDLHMGNGGRRDDLVHNEALLMEVLEKRYLEGGWTLVLNGDVEELQRFRLPDIRRRWAPVYALFDRFAAGAGLYKILGNHDDELRDEEDYPYPLLDALRIETGTLALFVYHGHQVSQLFLKYNRWVRRFLRYVLHPLGIKNLSVAKSPRRRFYVERRVYEFSRAGGIVSLLGHTHRPLFESLSRYDYLKFEVERLCRRYPAADGKERALMAERVRFLRRDLDRVKRRDKKRSILDTLYGDDLPVPCLFNSGCAIGKKGFTVLEIDSETISLVYWHVPGKEKRYVRLGGYIAETLAGSECRRVVLNSDRLDYVRARIELLA